MNDERIEQGNEEKQKDSLTHMKERGESKEAGNIRLTKRDEEIFRFLMDQKFATLEAIYFRFFDRRKSPFDPLPVNLFVTRQRLLLLQKFGFVSVDRVPSEAKSLYLLGPRGFQNLKWHGKKIAYAPPTKSVDFRNYLHDMKVTYCRVALEREGKALDWYPERRIRTNGYYVNGERVPLTVIPDGIFLSSKGERVVFEIESSGRRQSRFDQKAREYRSLIGQELIHRVIWVATDSTIGKQLLDAAGGWNRFTIERYETFTNKLLPKGKL